MGTPANTFGLQDILKTSGAFLVANMAGDTLNRMVQVTPKDGAKTFQTLQDEWAVKIHDKRNDIARSYNSSSINQILNYEALHPDVFSDYFNAVRDSDNGPHAEKINFLIDKIISLQEKAYKNEDDKSKPFYDLDSLLLKTFRAREGERGQDYSFLKGTDLQQMSEGFVDGQPSKLQPGNYNISNFKHYLPKKDRFSKFFNRLEHLPDDLKEAMNLNDKERLDYKLAFETKQFDNTLSEVQWEMNVIEGWNYGLLGFAANSKEYVTPKEHATGEFAVKDKTGAAAAQLALYDPELDKKYTEMYFKHLRENGATKEQMAIANAAIDHAKTIRKLAGNILVQEDLGGNAAWRTNQANHQVNGPQGQKPIMLARGQIIGKGGFYLMENAMSKLIDSINSIEKGNPDKQGDKSPWVRSQTKEYDENGEVMKFVTPEDLLSDGEIYNDAEKFYDLHLKRSDKNDTRFFRHDYVDTALNRMIAEDKDLNVDLSNLVDKVNQMHQCAILDDETGKTKVGYQSLEELISLAVSQDNKGSSDLDTPNRDRCSEEDILSEEYSEEYLNSTRRETLENNLRLGLKKGDDKALKELAKVAPEAALDLTVEQNRELVNQRKTEIIRSIKDNPDKEVSINGKSTTFLKELSNYLDVTRDKTKQDVMLIVEMIGGKTCERTGGHARGYKRSLGAFMNAYKLCIAIDERQMEENFHGLPDGTYEKDIALTPQNDLNEQFYEALLQGTTSTSMSLIKAKVEKYIDRGDMVKDRLQAPKNGFVDDAKSTKPRPKPINNKVNFGATAIALENIATQNISRFRNSVYNVIKTIKSHISPSKAEKGSATDRVFKALHNKFVGKKYYKPLLRATTALSGAASALAGGGLINFVNDQLNKGENLFNGLVSFQSIATGGIVAAGVGGLYSVGKAAWEVGRAAHNRATGFISTGIVTPLIGYIGYKAAQSPGLIQSFVDNADLPFSNEVVGAATSFFVAAVGVETAKAVGKWAGPKLNKVLTEKFDVEIKRAAKVGRNIGSAAAIGTVLALGLSGASAGEVRTQQQKEETIGAIDAHAQAAPEDEIYVNKNFVIDATTEAVKEYIDEKFPNVRSFRKLSAPKGFAASVGDQIVIYQKGEEPLLFSAKDDVRIFVPENTLISVDGEGYVRSLRIPEGGLDAKITTNLDEDITYDNVPEEGLVTLDDIAKKKSFEGKPDPEIAKVINATLTRTGNQNQISQ